MANPTCKTCGGQTIVNENKKSPKSPDFLCADPNCQNDKGFRSGVWLPSKTPRSNTPTPSTRNTTQESIASAVALKAAVELYSRTNKIEIEEVLKTADEFLEWLKGNSKPF